MKTRNSSESSVASCDQRLQKSEHWNAESWNIYIFATCSFEQATESSHTTQLNQRQNTEDSLSMQNHMCSFDKNQ